MEGDDGPQSEVRHPSVHERETREEGDRTTSRERRKQSWVVGVVVVVCVCVGSVVCLRSSSDVKGDTDKPFESKW